MFPAPELPGWVWLVLSASLHPNSSHNERSNCAAHNCLTWVFKDYCKCKGNNVSDLSIIWNFFLITFLIVVLHTQSWLMIGKELISVNTTCSVCKITFEGFNPQKWQPHLQRSDKTYRLKTANATDNIVYGGLSGPALWLETFVTPIWAQIHIWTM